MGAQHEYFFKSKIKNYEEILTGAHKNPTPRARTPFLTSQVAFWEPLKIKSANADIERENRKLDIDRYVQALWSAIRARNCQILTALMPNYVDGDLLLFSSYLDKDNNLHPYQERGSTHRSTVVQLISLVFDWHGARATVKLEKRTEYLTLTFIVDLSGHKSKEEQDLLKADEFSCISSAVRRLEELDRLLQSPQHDNETRYAAIFECLYNDIWDKFYSDILSSCRERQVKLGEIFADFRGLVLGATSDPQRIFQPPFWRVFDGERLDSVAPEFDAAAQLKKFWEFLSVRTERMDFSKIEFTACEMLKGRALYVSNLGAQPQIVLEDERFPVYFFMMTNAQSGWQIGRLVERMFNLGCERLAALVYFAEMRAAGYRMRSIDEAIQAVRAKYLGEDAKFQTSDRNAEGKLDKLARYLADELEVIERRVAELNASFGGEMEYRIERSRYYIQQFRDGLKALRIRRIEGFQPYGSFVERRLGPAFNNVEGLRAQYERLTAGLSSLVQFRIAVQGRAVLVAARDRNREIEGLQDFADLALWLALIPYYVGTLIWEHVFRQHDDAPSTSHYWEYLWGVIAMAGLGLSLLRKIRQGKWGRWAYVAVAGWLALAVISAYYGYRDWEALTSNRTSAASIDFQASGAPADTRRR